MFSTSSNKKVNYKAESMKYIDSEDSISQHSFNYSSNIERILISTLLVFKYVIITLFCIKNFILSQEEKTLFRINSFVKNIEHSPVLLIFVTNFIFIGVEILLLSRFLNFLVINQRWGHPPQKE